MTDENDRRKVRVTGAMAEDMQAAMAHYRRPASLLLPSCNPRRRRPASLLLLLPSCNPRRPNLGDLLRYFYGWGSLEVILICLQVFLRYFGVFLDLIMRIISKLMRGCGHPPVQKGIPFSFLVPPYTLYRPSPSINRAPIALSLIHI